MANKNTHPRKAKASGNNNLQMSRSGKTDEFYTQISLIEKELRHYKEFFRGKTVFCNCDDPEESNFWKYFELNFQQLGLKKLIATHYQTDSPSYKIELTRDINGDGKITSLDIVRTPLQENGDFRSLECREIMQSSDVIVTNPPFSLFREYVAQIMEYGKHLIIIGNQNAITYREFLSLLIDNKIWLGYTSGHFWFRVPDDYEEKKTDFKIDEAGVKWRRMGNICWFTNIDIEKRHEAMTLFRNYTPDKYPKYDNYDAINVNRTVDIPCDYFGVMGVPITFIDKHNPEQFDLIGDNRYHDGQDFADDINFINGKGLYRRLLIRRRPIQE
ncbi:MAG: modification methylase [Clostridiales bacterium GWB2_37_7]|nr:MAG: modification methylase [Clostridiales bacterium GWB2_37_7]